MNVSRIHPPMPTFDFDPSKVVASFEVYPKGEYEVQIGEPKSFIRKAGEDQHDSFGIRYPYVIKLPTEFENKRGVHTCYYHNEGSQGMSKQFVMAVMGYGKGRPEEERFDREVRGKDWAFDPTTGSVGDMYRELTGKRVIMSLDTQKNKETGEEQQKTVGFRSLTSGPIK